MKLLNLHISGFGKFQDQDVSFEDGLNVVYGKNPGPEAAPTRAG